MTQARPDIESVTVDREGLPSWLGPVVRAVDGVRPEQLSRFLPPPSGGRPSAVLILLGAGAEGPSCS